MTMISLYFKLVVVKSVHLAHSHADAKDGIGAQLVLVVSAIQGQLREVTLITVDQEMISQGFSGFDAKAAAYHKLVNLLLLNWVHALRHNLWGYQVVHVVHRLQS